MCVDCGCSSGESRIVEYTHTHTHHSHGHSHHSSHTHIHEHTHEHSDDNRRVKIEEDILSENNHYAGHNRDYFRIHHIFALNLVSSPGSGKTTLLVKTITALKDEYTIAVIEGDQQTSNDADKIRETGISAVQINTGKGCHLEAHGIGHALEHLKPVDNSFLFIENVGNLVCPSAFDLGEAHKIVVLSVTEGEDKPLKYPNMFAAADVMILTKIDLLPYLDFNVEQCIQYARQINPRIKIIQLSTKTNQGMETWLQWLKTSYQLMLLE